MASVKDRSMDKWNERQWQVYVEAAREAIANGCFPPDAAQEIEQEIEDCIATRSGWPNVVCL